MKDRLIKILNEVFNTNFKGDYESGISDMADKLLSEGVLVPPCKVGDDIYWIDSDTNKIEVAKSDIKAVCYYGDGEFKIICVGEKEPEDIGTRWSMLTREEAEKSLAERSEGEG